MSTPMVDIKGLDPVEVVAALYAASQPLGLGHLHFRPGDLPEEHKASLRDHVEHNPTEPIQFDYLLGRVMKVSLNPEPIDESNPEGGTHYVEFNPTWYDRDNGDGAAQRVIDSLRGENMK